MPEFYAVRDPRTSVRASRVCRAAAQGKTSLEPFDGRSGAEPPLPPIALPTSRALGRQRGVRSDPALLRSAGRASPLRVSIGLVASVMAYSRAARTPAKRRVAFVFAWGLGLPSEQP
jgi:hypothetical protein